MEVDENGWIDQQSINCIFEESLTRAKFQTTAVSPLLNLVNYLIAFIQVESANFAYIYIYIYIHP